MKIVSTEIIVLSDPSHYGGALAVLRIHTDERIVGISEMFSVPPGVAKAVLDGPDSVFGALLIGQNPIHPEHMWTRLYNRMIHGNRRGWAVICIGAVDVALWDIYGKAMDLPVYELLGGIERNDYQVHTESQRQEAVPYCSVIPDHYDRDSMISEQLKHIERLLPMGFRAFKIEPMHSAPEAVVDCARQARQLIGPELSLAVDVGYGLNDVPTAVWICDRLAEFDVMFFETPFSVDQVDAYAALARQSPVPLAMGEHAVSRWEFLQMMDYGGVEVIQPYAVTVGGLTEAKRVVDLAYQRGVSVVPGNWSTHIQMAANVHLCAYSPITPFFEYAPPEIFRSPLRTALGEVGLPITNGAVTFPTGPGIGVELPDDLIKHFRID